MSGPGCSPSSTVLMDVMFRAVGSICRNRAADRLPPARGSSIISPLCCRYIVGNGRRLFRQCGLHGGVGMPLQGQPAQEEDPGAMKVALLMTQGDLATLGTRLFSAGLI